MPLPRTALKYKNELVSLAENMPLKKVTVSEFRSAKFKPTPIRQPRTYTRVESGMQAIGRFLAERGTVEILQPEMTMHLFMEMHWNAYQIRSFSRKRFKNTRQWREALRKARGMVSDIESAEEELFIANRRLIVNCVKPFFWMGPVWQADFLQEGSKALSNAIRKFDPTRGTPFYAYAQKAVQNRLRNFFRDHVRSGSIGICPTRDMQAIKSILDTWREDHNEEPDNEVLAKITGMEEAHVKKVRSYVHQWESLPAPPVSLDGVLGDDMGNLYDLIEDKDTESAFRAAEKSEVWVAVDRLQPRARYIMRLRFIEGLTLEETGNMLDLTRARIKQIQDDSLRKLRQMLKHGVVNPLM